MANTTVGTGYRFTKTMQQYELCYAGARVAAAEMWRADTRRKLEEPPGYRVASAAAGEKPASMSSSMMLDLELV